MMTTSRLPLLIAAFFAAGAIAFGQRPSALNLEQVSPADGLALAPDWLRHGDPRQQAWAAHWIARDRQQQCVPQLLGVLATYQASAQSGSPGWNDQDASTLAVVDALIQLKADVPPESAEALYAKFQVPALVLLAQSHHDTREAMLGIFDGKSWTFTTWLAVADLLAANPPAGFAARLLKEISIHATIQVLSPGQKELGSGWGGDCPGSGGDGPRQDWPPVGAYRLAARPSAGSELLAAGENPVYLTRTLTKDYRLAALPTGDCDNRSYVTLSDLSRDLIGQLLGMKKDDFALQLNPSLTVTWSSAKAYLDAATAFVVKQEDILQNAQADLELQGLLTEAEAESARPPFEVGILDLREDKTPLPALKFADPSTSVTYQAVELDPAN